MTDWYPDAWYHRLLLAQLPTGAQRVLHVGCGAGTLSRVVAGRVPHVGGIDHSPVVLDAAGVAAPGVTQHLADAVTADLRTRWPRRSPTTDPIPS
ncbi:MAG: methyltransferase [Blastococcus sp.]|jgi:trans-aconitate methyltransferase|nr:methyltransferase [Blastococcus sp.]